MVLVGISVAHKLATKFEQANLGLGHAAWHADVVAYMSGIGLLGCCLFLATFLSLQEIAGAFKPASSEGRTVP